MGRDGIIPAKIFGHLGTRYSAPEEAGLARQYPLEAKSPRGVIAAKFIRSA
jgi:hypothetical protein